LAFNDQQCDGRLLWVLIGQLRENREINTVFGKAPGVLGHAELLEPVRNVLHRGRTLAVWTAWYDVEPTWPSSRGDDPWPVFRYCVVLFEPRATFKTISASAILQVGGLVIGTALQLWSLSPL
jgi:hypothetical protein